MELGGTVRGTQYDSLNIAGSMDDGGMLDVQLITGFVPQPTDGIVRVVHGGLTFSAWANASGIPGAQPNDNHDNDGDDNGTEFALGLFPLQPGTVLPNGGFFTYPDGERLRVLFTRPLDRTGLTLKVQASDDLVIWTDVAVSVNSAPFSGAGFVSENRAHPVSEPGLVEVRDILNSATTPRRQIRVLIEITP